MSKTITSSTTIPIRDINEKYMDLDLSLSIHPLTGKYKTITGNRAIIRSIKHLVMSSQWDIPFEPEIYGGLDEALFELNTPIFISSLQKQIHETIAEHEPRVNVIDVDIVQTMNQTISINITFEIVATEEVLNTSITLKRDR